MPVEQIEQTVMGGRQVVPCRRPLLQNPPGAADEPVVAVQLPLYQLFVGRRRHVHVLLRRRVAMHDLVDPPAGAMHAVVVVTFAQVRPVGEIDTAVRPVFQFDSAEPRLVGEQKIRLMPPRVARAVSFEPIVIDAPSMHVAGEHGVAVAIRPIVAQIDHPAAMRMPAPQFAMLAHRVARGGPILARVPVVVIRTLVDQVVQMRPEIVSVHPPVMSARHDMPQVPDHVVGKEELAEVVVVQAPRVGRAVRDDFEFVPNRMETPDRTVQPLAIVFRGTRRSDQRRGLDAVPSVQPTVRSPDQAVDDVVPHAAVVEPVEHHSRLSVGNVVAVLVRNHDQPTIGQQPNAAEPEGDPRDAPVPLPEHGANVEAAIVVGVLQDQHPIPELVAEVPAVVGVALDDPHPPAVVQFESDRLGHIRFAGKQGDAKSCGDRDRRSRLLRSRRPIGGVLGIHHGREIVGQAGEASMAPQNGEPGNGKRQRQCA